MRHWVAVVLILCWSPALALAEPSESASTATAHVAAARESLDVIFVESGALSAVASNAFQSSSAQIWGSFTSNPDFLRIDAGKREALQRYLNERYPAEATNMVLAHAPHVIDDYAPRMAALFSVAELRDVSQFYRTADAKSWFIRSAISHNAEPTAAEQAALAAFTETAGGRAWSEEFNQLIERISSDFITSVAPQIRTRVMQDMCDILGEDCPPGFVQAP